MTKSNLDDGSPIDLHARLAVIELVLGTLVAGVYYVFSQLGVVAPWVWKLVLAVQCFVSIVLYVHYLTNRKSRRLWVEGIVSMLALVPWLAIAFVWLFYVLYIPIPVFLRILVALVCFSVIVWHATMVLVDFRRASKNESVMITIYHNDGRSLILRHSCSGYIDHLTSRTPFKGTLMWVLVCLMPFAAAIGSNANHVLGGTVGPNVLGIVVSLLGFPMSISIIGNTYVKTMFFRVYLPLKLERKTGKRVVLAQRDQSFAASWRRLLVPQIGRSRLRPSIRDDGSPRGRSG